MTSANASPALEAVGISKRFGDCVSVRDGSLVVEAGTVHAVVGENGAGKTTLLKIAAGILTPSAGTVSVLGKRLTVHSAEEGRALGVAMVQQHFALFNELTTLENIILGAEPTRAGGRIDVTVAKERASRALAELGVSIPLDAKVGALGVGDKQRLEIARALYREARVVILDEPTAILTPQESNKLYETLRRMTKDGRAVVVVTHKLREVQEHADVVTVMRRGETLATRKVTARLDASELAAELVAGEALPPLATPPAERALGDVRLTLRDVTAASSLAGVSLEVRAGEILGIAGVLGNGQSELALVLGGLLTIDSGTVTAGSIEVVHEDRHAEGLVLDASVADNLVLGELARFTHHGMIDDAAVSAAADNRIATYDVRPPLRDAMARTLSGGNQQKLVIARALARAPEVLVIAHPTRGVDIIAAHAIHEQILHAAAQGTAVLIIGADLAELRLLSHRILVMFRGRIVASLPREADDATLGAAMLGGAMLGGAAA